MAKLIRARAPLNDDDAVVDTTRPFNPIIDPTPTRLKPGALTPSPEPEYTAEDITTPNPEYCCPEVIPTTTTEAQTEAVTAVVYHSDAIQTAARNLSELVHRPPVAEIMKNPAYKIHEKNYRLSLLGLTCAEIAFLTQSAKNNVSRDVWAYRSGKRTLKQ